jgi:hypothetical protein
MTEIAHPVDREEVMAWLDGEVSETRAFAVAEHVKSCAECRTLTGELEHVSAALASWDVPALAPGLAMPPVAPTTHARPTVRRPAIWIGLAAASVALVTLTLPLARSGPASVGIEVSDATPSMRTVQTSRPELQQSQQGAARTTTQSETALFVRVATLTLATDDFDRVRSEVERLTTTFGGHISMMQVSGQKPQTRSMSATLRIPATRLSDAVAALRGLARVTQESMNATEVTDQHRDLTIRVANSRREEQRLVELLAQRTGDLKDVLAVEETIARVRTDIERMEAEQRALNDRVSLATITLTVSENYRAAAELGPVSFGTRMRNAFLDGAADAIEGLTTVVVGLTGILPVAALWSLLLAWPVLRLWKAIRRGFQTPK